MTHPTPRLRTLVAAAALLAVCAEAGGAATLRGTIGPDRLVGTATADLIEGRGGDDFLHGGAGRDRIDAGPGADRVAVHYDAAADRVRCGLGRDVVTADLGDTVAADCELVSVQLSRDTAGFSVGRVQHETQVEPDSLAVGRTIVVAFQSGRFEDGGAAAVNWATSTDAGRTWRTGFVPNLAVAGTPSGRYDRVSDPVVAYDANRGLWLIASLGLVDREVALLVSRSRDAIRWDAPIVAAAGPSESLDKEWLVCDNGAASPFRGRCYLAYLDARSGRIAVQRSDDAGATWSAAVEPEAVSALGSVVNGAFPIVRPDGSLVVAFTVFNAFGILGVDDIVAMSSTDGGVTFADPVLVSRAPAGEFYGIRAPLLVSGDVDAAAPSTSHGPTAGSGRTAPGATSSSPARRWPAPGSSPVACPRGPGRERRPLRAGPGRAARYVGRAGTGGGRLPLLPAAGRLRAGALPGDRRLARPLARRRQDLVGPAPAQLGVDAPRLDREHRHRAHARRLRLGVLGRRQADPRLRPGDAAHRRTFPAGDLRDHPRRLAGSRRTERTVAREPWRTGTDVGARQSADERDRGVVGVGAQELPSPRAEAARVALPPTFRPSAAARAVSRSRRAAR